MKIKYTQVDCREEINSKNWNKPDFRQAEHVLKFRPDIIITESAANRTPDTIYNKFNTKQKPLQDIKKHQQWLKKVSKVPGNGDAISDVLLWNNIMKLWNDDHNVLVYNTDGPDKLRSEFFEVWKYMYPCALKNWLWWVRIYLREKYMVENIRWVLEKNKGRKELHIAIFLQNFHWEHVKFLMNNPTKKEIWNYYFAQFKEISPKNITEKIKEQNKVFYKYWLQISDFK